MPYIIAIRQKSVGICQLPSVNCQFLNGFPPVNID
jgi:hypothetical protein